LVVPPGDILCLVKVCGEYLAAANAESALPFSFPDRTLSHFILNSTLALTSCMLLYG
jgi:hypothetical protein